MSMKDNTILGIDFNKHLTFVKIYIRNNWR